MVTFHTLVELMQPSLLEMVLLVNLLNTGRPFTGGNCNKSPTNKTFIEPYHSEPPNISSSLRCMYTKFKLESMDTSSMMTSFKERRLVRITFCVALESGQYSAVLPSCSMGS